MSILLSILTHSMPMVSFLPPEHIKKRLVFLFFSEGIEKQEAGCGLSGARMTSESWFEHS